MKRCLSCEKEKPLLAFRRHIHWTLNICMGCEWKRKGVSEIPVKACVECRATKTYDSFGRTGLNWHRTCIECKNKEEKIRACTSCGEEKSIQSFRQTVNRHGKANYLRQCKSCENEKSKKYRSAIPKDVKSAYARSYREKNRETYLAKRRAWDCAWRRRVGMQERVQVTQREPRLDKDMVSFDARHIRALRHVAEKTLPQYGWTAAEMCTWRQRNDPRYVVNQRMRVQIRKALQSKKAGRRWEEMVGYTVKDLITHIERQLPRGWTINEFLANGWHIDHIVPKSTFDVSCPEQLRACWSLPNLQPLSAKANMSKGAKRLKLL